MGLSSSVLVYRSCGRLGLQVTVIYQSFFLFQQWVWSKGFLFQNYTLVLLKICRKKETPTFFKYFGRIRSSFQHIFARENCSSRRIEDLGKGNKQISIQPLVSNWIIKEQTDGLEDMDIWIILDCDMTWIKTWTLDRYWEITWIEICTLDGHWDNTWIKAYTGWTDNTWIKEYTEWTLGHDLG